MKISMQIIYFFASLALVLFVPCFAFVPTTVADPGGPEGGFTYYLAAWDGSSTYSDGKFFLTNDLRGSTLVDLENDANGYLPIIFDFGVPIYGNPDGTGFPVTFLPGASSPSRRYSSRPCPRSSPGRRPQAPPGHRAVRLEWSSP